MSQSLRHLVVVACHAPFKETTLEVPERPEEDDAWVLQSFQAGEPPLYIAHLRRGVELLKKDPQALLLFSGGYTRREAGLRWSEAATYRAIARYFRWWTNDEAERSDLDARTDVEDSSRDSFENLLFSVARFQQLVGRYPEHVTLVSWAFKRERFDRHRAAIRFPARRFTFDGQGAPLDLPSALRGEAVTMAAFERNPYGNEPALIEKRRLRNPFNRLHTFGKCPGLGAFFDFIADPHTQACLFEEQLPWEE